jgi:hypothetical protein
MRLEEEEGLADDSSQDTSGDEARRRLLSDHGMRYVFHGRAEMEVAHFDLSEDPIQRSDKLGECRHQRREYSGGPSAPPMSTTSTHSRSPLGGNA